VPSAAPDKQIDLARRAALEETPDRCWPGHESDRADISLGCEPTKVPADGDEAPQAWIYYLTTRHSLLTTRYSLLPTHYSLLTTHTTRYASQAWVYLTT
jgi:hypothetical protein